MRDGVLRFGPILFKQVPYTMAKFAVFEVVSEKIIAATGTAKADLSAGMNTSINLGAGLTAGLAAAVVSALQACTSGREPH